MKLLRLFLVCSAVYVVFGTFSSTAHAWWDANWMNRMKITFDNTSTSPETLTNFPAHVGLSTLNIDFDKVKASGADIRFVDSDDSTELNYEIENWNESATSTIWVKVPQIDTGSSDYIYLYYNNTGASDNQNANGVWSAYDNAYHLNEAPPDDTNAFVDSAGNGISGRAYNLSDGDGGSSGATGYLAGGVLLEPTDDFVQFATSGEYTTSFTASLWIYLNDLDCVNYNDVLMHRDAGGTSRGWKILQECGSLSLYLSPNGSTPYTSRYSTSDLTATTWHNVVTVYDSVNQTIELYIDGDAVGGTYFNGPVPTSIYATPSIASSIGLWGQGNVDGYFDEIRLASGAQSAAWVEADYKSMTETFLTFATEESFPDTPSSLGPTSLVDGSYTADNTPTLTFTQSDPDASETLAFQVQIDDSSDFGSVVVDYTSSYLAEGSTSFTVGQAVGSGTYTTGSASQTLTDGNYYWRVRSGDGTATSSYATANSGAIAFRVDATAPSPASFSTTPSADSSSAISMGANTATDAGSGSVTYTFTETSGNTGGSSSGAGGASYTDDGLTPCTDYTYTVTVTDAVGNTRTSAGSTVKTNCLGGGTSGSTASSFNPDGSSSLKYETGTLVKYPDDPRVFYVNGNIIQHIPDEQTFLTLGFSWDQIITIPVTDVIAQGAPVTTNDVIQESTVQKPVSSTNTERLVKYPNDPKVYVIRNNTKYWITTEDVFTSLNFSWDQIETLSDMETYRSGIPLYE